MEALYAYPRAFMGLLAVLDTLLVYLIADRMFGRRVAAVTAVIFAVTPMSLMLRMVLLDSILLPFVLSSVLLALYSRGSAHLPVRPAASADARTADCRIFPPIR